MKPPKLLSPSQRGTLSAIAHEAYKRLQQGLDESFDDFRRTEARAITRKLKNAPPQGWTISEAPASAFDCIFDHFKTLKGDVGEVFDRQLQGVSSTMRNHLHNIAVAERAAGVKPAYTAAICRRMFGQDEPGDERQALAILSALQAKARKDAALRRGEEVAS